MNQLTRSLLVSMLLTHFNSPTRCNVTWFPDTDYKERGKWESCSPVERLEIRLGRRCRILTETRIQPNLFSLANGAEVSRLSSFLPCCSVGRLPCLHLLLFSICCLLPVSFQMYAALGGGSGSCNSHKFFIK